MLEGLAAWVLNTYVGEYVENLNTDQLSIALLQGAVELDNLPLKKDALRSLGLPLIVKSGFIGKITLQIPLRRLHSEPWVISIERLYLVAGPITDTQYDEEAERKSDQARKEAMLAEMESKWQIQKAGKQEWSWFSYGASVATNILENLQLKVKDVHMRYEDDQLNPACPFAFGVVIKELSAQSTDGSWIPKFVSRDNVDMMHKLLDLQNFAVYFDTNSTLVGDLDKSAMADALMREMYISSITNNFKDHEYILSPVSAQGKMKRNTSAMPLRSPSTPRIAMDLSLEQMAFALSEDQYRNLVTLLKELDRKDRQKRYWRWRPQCSLAGNAKAWWKYAIDAQLHQIREQNKRCTKDFMLTRARNIVLYYQAYRQHLCGETLETDSKNHKAKMEEELGFDELKILRKLAYKHLKDEGKLNVKPPSPAPAEPVEPSDSADKGVLQRWFPGWGGWYGAKSDSGTELASAGSQSAADATVGEPPTKISKTELEQELSDVLEDVIGEDDKSMLKRDAVFATLNFCLDSGSFKLLSANPSTPQDDGKMFSVLELECSVISMLFESRPRSRGMKFGVSVGGLVLLDKVTENTSFPALVGSQNKDKFGVTRHMANVSSQKSSKSLSVIVDESGDSRLFELMYEKNPFNSTANYRFSMKTKPLDIVYNKTAINKIREFFSSKKLYMSRHTDSKLTGAARRHYETLKRQTQAELKQTLEQLLEGSEGVQVKRWEIDLDISAPQIIIPESFTDTNASMVVLDLGNIRFQNQSPLSKDTSSQTLNDDDFHTPMSTPPNEPSETDSGATLEMSDLSLQGLTELQFYNKLYDKYTLDLTDLQVMVGRMKDNWRSTHHRGSTLLHLVDRFSITLQLERRLIYTTEPQWPTVTVSGTLPHLTIHVNEHKVQTVNTCIKMMSQKPVQQTTPHSSVSLSESSSGVSLDDLGETSAQNLSSQEEEERVRMGGVLGDSQLLQMQFTINHMSLEIHSRDRAVAELQVSRVKTHLIKRPYDTSVTLTVHSLLVVDALQSYGPDFELLVASHKNLTLDSASGSIRNSGPTSPTSPRSPPSSPMECLPSAASQHSSLQTVQDAVTRAFHALVTGKSSEALPGAIGSTRHSASSPLPDSEALITLEFEMISAKSPSNTNGDGPLNIANFQFNNLDVIANQETLVEILSFLKRTVPSSRKSLSTTRYQSSFDISQSTESHDKSFLRQDGQRQMPKIEVTADFNRLSLLMMRLDTSSGTKTARKVATATMSCARVQATLDSELSMSGSLGGFHVFDITPDVQRHQRVFSVGHDGSSGGPVQPVFSSNNMYKTANESMLLDDFSADHRAFSFKFSKPRTVSVFDRSRAQANLNDSEVEDNCINVSVKMASLCYTHSPRTVHELSQCVSEFKDYMASVAKSIKNAAAEVAKGMVAKRQDMMHTSLYGSNHSLDSFSGSRLKLNQTSDRTETEHLDTTACMDTMDSPLESRIVLEAALETPVIVIPQSSTSSKVLVAHLGQISVSNKGEGQEVTDDSSKEKSNDQDGGNKKVQIFMEVKNMNLHSVDLDEVRDCNASPMELDESYLPSNDSYINTGNGTPIMHNTTIQVALDYVVPVNTVIHGDTTQDMPFEQCSSRTGNNTSSGEEKQPLLDISAKIQTPVKMVLSKHVYEQILKTSDNLSYIETQDYDPDSDNNGTPQSDTVISPDDSSATLKDDADASSGSKQSFSMLDSGQKTSVYSMSGSSHKTSGYSLSGSSQKSGVFISKQLKLEVPKFSVELRGDFGEGEQGLVELKLYTFQLDYMKDNPATTNMQLFLKSLVMDDLLEPPGSPHRQIMVSKAPKKKDSVSSGPKQFLSSSCPDNAIVTPVPVLPPSLPSSFHEDLASNSNSPKSPGPGRGRPFLGEKVMPGTPPPSWKEPRGMSMDDVLDENLVHISLILVDKSSPEFTDKYNKTKRFVDVDFSCLDTKINLQTWVVLLDFLGLGAKVHDIDDMRQPEKSQDRTINKDEEGSPNVNSEMNLKVENLTIILNKPEYQFAQASISKLSSHVTLRDGNFAMKGQLGSMSLLDLSPNGQLYRERFMTVGKQALEFDFFKFGIPDPWLHREFDMKLKLRMASVRYVHTNRFHAETLGFVQHFLQLQDVLGRMRAASAGKQINETAFHAPRLLLDIEAGSPIILIPHSSRTTDVFVANLGTLTVKNCFKVDGDSGTFNHDKRSKSNSPESRASSVSSDTLQSPLYRSNSQISASTPQLPNPLTQSLFDELQPPRSHVDPMTESIYGGLDVDFRSDVSVSDTVLGSNEEIYDPTEIPLSPATDGSSVDPFSLRSHTLSISQSETLIQGETSKPAQSSYSTPHIPLSAAAFQNSSDSTTHERRSVFACHRVSPGGRDDEEHQCLLEIMDISLSDMDLFSAERVEKKDYRGNNLRRDLEFPSCVIQRQGNKLLREKCVLNLKVERNLEGEISHAVPDWRVQGAFSSVHCCLDVNQYKLIRGLLEHNLGEKMEVFKKDLMTHMQDPKIQTVLGGDVWTVISMSLDLTNVTVELLTCHQQGPSCPESSLAKLDFIRSQLTYDSYSDQSKEVDLVSHEIQASDTRYQDVAVNLRPSVFEKILQSSSAATPDSLQMELHYRASSDGTRFKVLLNNMKLMCIFDWLLNVNEFLMTKAENPFLADGEEEMMTDVSRQTSVQSTSDKGSRTSSPLSSSGGIITKRSSHVQQTEVPFELKLNVTETEFVVVESMASWDTNAVILKCTAVMSYRPKAVDKLMSCTLQSLEVFSCSLLAEEDTAMSIVDPMTISCELNADPLPDVRCSSSGGLLEASAMTEHQLLLEVNFNRMNIRLSYHDLRMFLAIMNSLPDQALNAKQSKQRNSPQSQFPEVQLSSLESLGFSRADCERALKETEGRTDEAAIWLTENAAATQGKTDETKITAVELKSNSLCVCLIDDCLDADVPLAELAFNGLNFNLKLKPNLEGKATFQLVSDYYNRVLSGWEPVIEPWRCHVDWKDYHEGAEKKFAIQIAAPDVLNVNLTRTLIEQYNKTKVKWTEDYSRQQEDSSPDGTMSGSAVRRRQPFTPYIIRNHTGCPLWFLTVTMSPSSVGSEEQKFHGQKMDDAYIQATEWKNVPSNEEIPFYFFRREKIRHKKSHSLHVNQLVVKVEGWQRLSPVSVDKVGVYFRNSYPDRSKSIIQVNERQMARVVFDVSQEGSARKVITLRSALIVHNRLDGSVEVKMDSPIIPGRHEYMTVEPDQQKSVPMGFVHAKLSLRPVNWGVSFCNPPLDWHHVQKPGETINNIRSCHQMGSREREAFRFCVAVHRELYPEEVVSANTMPLPGHTLTIMPPVTVVNLLPIEMNYYMRGTDISGCVKPGKEAQLHAADLNQEMELGVHLENFPNCRELVIPPGTNDYRVKLRLYDHDKRPLELNVHILSRIGGSLRLGISCHYWLVNKSGLPLIFRQDYSKEAAGQFQEHELARSVTPLLFSFADKENAFQCSMRVGKSVHGTQGVPHWCSSFILDSGVGRRQLHVSTREENRPDWVYNIGIEVRQGKGRFRDTNIVTFAPRYQIDNQSSHKLAIAQRHFTNKEAILNPDGHLTALPKCKLPFHWPRLDLDQLLCVRILSVLNCNWSGGFKIDKISSFHINMRDERRNSVLLKVEVILQGPTYYVIFTDAEEMPPPFRIDNLSEVPLLYYQTKAPDDRLRATIKPRTSLPYAWDEPTLDPYMTLSVANGTVATYNLNKLEEGDQLCYQNFIYITATATFPKMGGAYSDLQHRELVLDCQHDNHVVFKKREAGKRSQLWRMTGDGMLEHEGLMPPRDPRKSSSGSAHRLVLDIADIALQPGKPVPLMLKKADDRRRAKQTWCFTESGLLCCSTGYLCVQAVDGLETLQDGAIAVLGTGPPPQGHVPPHMAMSRRKLHPGSGCLTVRVLMDGPIRVLQIADIKHRHLVRVRSRETEDWEVYEETLEQRRTSQQQAKAPQRNIELSLNLKGGIGVSLVNSVPEELLYLSLRNITLYYVSNPSAVTMEMTVASIQADNQLFGTQRPVMLFVTPTSKRDFPDNTPALHIAAHKVPNNNWNAEIYKHLIISMRKMTVQLEERLLWKLIQFGGYQQSDPGLQRLDDDLNVKKALDAATSKKVKRYYFGTLKINTTCITLSMLTASRLSPDLKAIKSSMSIPLIRFEDAKVDLDPFVSYHPFETSTFIMREAMSHYTEELKSQAAKILGSVDFLGNPLGLFNDVTEGISGLIKDGNLGGLVKNVVHGISNSTAKVTGAMSDQLGRLNDTKHNELREQIKTHSDGSGGHLVAGIKGLGHGIWGGAVSMVTQSYDGAKEAGIGGFLVGLTKGVVGTVSRPTTGILDLATGAANAIKDGSQRSAHMLPSRERDPRCCHGPGGLLPSYSRQQAATQSLLYRLNDQRYEETLIALEQLRFGQSDSLRALITSRQVYFLRKFDPHPDNVILRVPHRDLYQCKNIENNGRYYIELVLKGDPSGSIPNSSLKRPQVRCDKQTIAQKVTQQVNYAKNLYDEQKHTLVSDSTDDDNMD